MNEKYVLTLTPEQAAMVERACELMARLHIGQFECITDVLLDLREANLGEYHYHHDLANELLRAVACLIFGVNKFGVPDVKLHDTEHQRAWLVYTTLRYARMRHDYSPDDMPGYLAPPINWTDEPTPECEIVSVETNAKAETESETDVGTTTEQED